MGITREQYTAAYRDLGLTTCASCGNKKRQDQSFCRRCYYALSPVMRQKLYDPDGYAETYTEALEILSKKKVGGAQAHA